MPTSSSHLNILSNASTHRFFFQFTLNKNFNIIIGNSSEKNGTSSICNEIEFFFKKTADHMLINNKMLLFAEVFGSLKVFRQLL